MLNTNIVQKLSVLLASTYTLSLKTQNFHWNVKGPFFQTLHLMFEKQYMLLALANDAIAERIRSLGPLAPATYREFAQMTLVEEPVGELSAEAMVEALLEDYEKLNIFIVALHKEAADAGDEGTVDLITGRLSEQEKTAWMLRSFLGR
jgi:starvation-inducible DNA-binding protein